MKKPVDSIAKLALTAEEVEGEHVEIRFVPLQFFDLNVILWGNNAKKHDIGGVYESIERYGFIDPPKWDSNLNGGGGGMIYGNGRTKTIVSALLQAKKDGMPPPQGIPVSKDSGEWCIPVKFGIDQASEAIAQAAAIDHNNLTLAGGDFDHFAMMKMWDEGPYLALLQQIAETGTVPVTVDEEAIASLLLAQIEESKPPREPGPGTREDDDYAGKGEPIDQIVPRMKYGEIWSVGDHRVMCGDSRIREHVDALLDGKKINVAFTSPPYASQRKYDEKSAFKPIDPNDYIDWFEPIQSIIRSRLAIDGSFFLNVKEHVDEGQRHLYVKKLTIKMVELFGWRLVDEFCWQRPGTPGSWPNRFKNSWEPVFHYANNKTIKFDPIAVSHESDGAITPGQDPEVELGNGSYWNLPSERTLGLAWPSNVIKMQGASSESQGHQAAFPIGLPLFFVKGFSELGDIVYDPFMGSGTTAVAADRCGRISYGIEISPAYCEIILRRLEAQTQKTASIAN